jgi:ferric-dicitrate binding protein FerR (iron transport regulator)
VSDREDEIEVAANGAHLPKLRALRALQSRRLSAAGESRLQRHLEGCQACRRALVGLRLADTLIEEARTAELAVDFNRIAAGLARSQVAERRRRTLRLAATVPLAAAAAAAGVWIATRPAPESEPFAHAPVPPPIAAPASVSEPPVFPAGLAALAGPGVLRHADGVEEPLRIDTKLHEGDVLELGAESVAHIRFDRASGAVIAPGTQLGLVRLRSGETQVELRLGRITNQVQPLSAAEHFRIRAAGYEVSVHGTHFEVTAANEALGVMVADGRVTVQDPRGGPVLADLHARDHFAIDATFGMRLATRDASQPLQLDDPRGLGVPLEQWPIVRLLDVQALESLGLTGLVLDGTRFPVRGELAVRVPRGDVTLIVERLTMAPQKIVLHVPEEGLSLALDALRKLLKPEKAAVHARGDAAEIDFEPVLAVVHEGTASLQRCYERSLKQRPDLDGRLTMRISVSARGSVQQAQPRGQSAELPDDLVACLRTVSAKWRFPATGSALTFDVPLRLSPR